MTDKEARGVLGDVSAYLSSRAILENEMLAGHTFTDICNAIKTLEQQPNEDCINRHAVNELVDELARAISDERCCISRGRSTANIMQDILDLPSVTPQPKIGKWIADVDRWGDIVTTVNGYRCSECNTFDTDKDNYCPNCGAKMEVEE